MRKSHKIMARVLMVAACITALVFMIQSPKYSTNTSFVLGIVCGLLLFFTVLVFKKTK